MTSVFAPFAKIEPEEFDLVLSKLPHQAQPAATLVANKLAHGRFDDRAHRRSLQLAATTHRGWLALAAAGLARPGVGPPMSRAGAYETSVGRRARQ
jgi:hypothetical protein